MAGDRCVVRYISAGHSVLWYIMAGCSMAGIYVELKMAMWENKLLNQLYRPHRFCFYSKELCKKNVGYKQVCKTFFPLA